MKTPFKVKLRVNGYPPKYMKVMTGEGDDYGVVYIEDNTNEFKRTDLKISGIVELRLYEQIYHHIFGKQFV